MQNLPFKVKLFGFNFLLLSLCGAEWSAAQELRVITRMDEYRELVEQDSLQKMVDLHRWVPSAAIDLRYATDQNFTQKRLYPRGNQTFVRLPVARALQQIEKELAQKGYQLKIWDAYRPHAATKKMWKLIGDERYVANPAKGSGHNRGLAIDLTLIKEGKEVNMGTGFDHFSDTAHHAFTGLPEQVLQNRKLLRETMEKHGFRALETEWWHFSWPNDRNYDVLDLSFRKLKKATH